MKGGVKQGVDNAVRLCGNLTWVRSSHAFDQYNSEEIENNIKENISNEIEEIKPDNKKINISNSSAEDIFGDEQTFPFVAGLGKNAAH